jgi:hypothetical protein
MAETKKSSSSRSTRKAMPAKASTPSADLKISEVQPTLLAPEPTIEPAPVSAPVAAIPQPEAVIGTVQMVAEATPQVIRHVSKKTEESREILRLAIRDAATASTRGALEVNDKMIEAFRVQSDAALAVWQSALAAGSLPEAMRIQTNGIRNAYETATAQWKDIAATTTRWFGQSVEPIQSVWTNR